MLYQTAKGSDFLQYLPLIIGAYLIYFIISKIPVFIYRNGISAIMKKDYEKGLTTLDKTFNMNLKPAQKVQCAYAELKFGDIKKARKKLNLIMLDAKAKENAKNEARCISAIVYLNEGDLNEARELMDALYSVGFKHSNFFATYGYIAILSGDSEYYNRINDEAYDYNKDNVVIQDNYAWCKYLNGDLDEALKLYEEAIEKEPSFPEIYYNYALTLIKKENNEKAKEMLEKALEQEFFGITTIKREQVEAVLARL